MQTLQTPTDIFNFFGANQTPFYYISTSTFNLLGMDARINNLRFINTINSFAGHHPHVFVPPGAHAYGRQGIEAANNDLLNDPAVADYVRCGGADGYALFLMFDEQVEQRARQLGLRVAFPPAKLRADLDNKITTTRLGNQAGIPSVPNVLAHVESYAALRQVARHLGPDLVVQLPYGDSGATTFFIATEADYRLHAALIAAQPLVKIMRRIHCRQLTIEGCVTRHGTAVGPLMTEMIGFPELTPFQGGWCGDEVFGAGASNLLSPALRQVAYGITSALGTELRQQGYWGCFGLDFLLDQVSGDIYLGELNPRITGVTPLTSQTALDQNAPPLLLLHLLEALGVAYTLDLAQYNQPWLSATATSCWSQLILERTAAGAERFTQVPPSGVWRMAPDGTVHFAGAACQVESVTNTDECFFIPTVDAGHQPGQGVWLRPDRVGQRLSDHPGGLPADLSAQRRLHPPQRRALLALF